MWLISYVKTLTRQAVTNIRGSQRFESMYTLQGTIQSACHTLSMLGLHMALDYTYLTWSVYINISRVVNRVGRMHCSREKNAPDSTSQPDWVARGTHLSFSPNTTIEAVRLIQAPIDGKLLDLLCPHHQHTIDTLNVCSYGPTNRSLTDTGRNYNLRGVGLPHHTPRSFQLMILYFPSKSPVRS
jgi:hypothetical protein